MMKRKNKNLLTLALAFMVVGAGVGAVQSFHGTHVNDLAVAAADDSVFEDDITSIVSVKSVSLRADFKSRYDVVIDFGGITFNSATFYTNQYPNCDQIGVKITDYIVINGQTMTELYAKYNSVDARKEWIDDLDDGEKANTENEDWGFNKGWVPVVGQVNTNNLTLMIDRRLVAPTDLQLTIKSGLELSYTDDSGAAIGKITQNITFTLIPDATDVEKLVGVRTSNAEIVETEVTGIALQHVAETDKNIQYQVHTDLLFSKSYTSGRWTADHYMYLNDYFTINGKTFSWWNKETYLAEYTTGAINSTAWQYSVPLLDFLWAKSEIANGSGTVFQFYISKAWMTAMEIDENTMTLGVREGLTYLNADGKVAKTTNAISWQKPFKATVVVDGETSDVTYTVSNKAEKLAEIAAKLPENTAEYTYAWSEALPAELPLEDGKTYTVTKTAVEYTATLDYLEGDDATLTYTVENRTEKLAELKQAAQEKSDAQYKYAWDFPEELPLENGKTYQETKTAARYDVTFTADGASVGEGLTFTADTKDALTFPEVPVKEGYTGAWDIAVEDIIEWRDYEVEAVYTAIEYTATVVVDGETSSVTYTIENRAEKLAEIAAKLPADTTEYTYAWEEKLPETLPLENDKTYTVTKTEVVPEPSDSSSSSNNSSENPVDSSSENQSSSSKKPVDSSSSDGSSSSGGSITDLLSGCFGSISGLSVGVLALGAAAMLLKKKKEDK